MINALIVQAARSRASDIFVKPGYPVSVRDKNGKLKKKDVIPQRDDIQKFLNETIDRKSLLKDILHSFDTEYGEFDVSMTIRDEEGAVRARLNIFWTQDGITLAIRPLYNEIPRMRELGLPLQFQNLRNVREGLILFSGATGSGKTTAMYSYVDAINQESCKHIITLDDPTEIILEEKESVVSQREIGRHSESFASALRAALREAPDIIMIGEMRDKETIRTALQAAETGHLVISTIHASDVKDCLSRILSYFPAEEHAELRHELSASFTAIIGCRLLPKAGGGRVGAYATLFKTLATTSILRNGRLEELDNYMNRDGMQTMDMAIQSLKSRGLIDEIGGI